VPNWGCLMDGIILTVGVGGGGSPGNLPIELTIASGDTEQIDVYDGSSCPYMTWQVSASDRTSLINATRFFTISALHDFEGNADFNCYSILGAEFNLTINISTGIPDTNIVFSITNNEAFPLDICAIRMTTQ